MFMRRGTQFSGRYQQGQCVAMGTSRGGICTGLKYVASRDRPQLWSQDGYPQARDIRRKDGSKWAAWVVWVEGCWYFNPQMPQIPHAVPLQVTSVAEAWPEEGRPKPQDLTAAFSLRLELLTSKEVRRWESQNHAVWLCFCSTPVILHLPKPLQNFLELLVDWLAQS